MITPGPVQTTYNQYETAAQIGMLGSGVNWNASTRIADDPAGVGIGFGLVVSQGSLHGDRSVVLGQASGTDIVGITLTRQTLPNLVDVAGQFTDKYSDGENVSVVDFGEVWVAPATNVNPGDPVYFNSVTGALGNSGISNAVLYPGAHWKTSLPRPSTTPGSLVPFNSLAVVRLGTMF